MPRSHAKRHGELEYALVDEDLFVELPHSGNGFRVDKSSAFGTAPADNKSALLTLSAGALPQADLFRFGRMFRRPNLPEFRPDRQDLIDLGHAMKESVDAGVNPKLPAGYTLLGQFIDHDMTFDPTEGLPYGAVESEELKSKRSPSLDLDSLYGLDEDREADIARVYHANRIDLAIGPTVPDPFVKENRTFPNDLPRGLDPCKPAAMAMTIDPRNDENLAIAQMHLAFIKFHNAVVKFLSKTIKLEEQFQNAREVVTQHYQSIILDDYLPQIIEPEILNAVINDGCRHFVFKEDEKPFMPIEFSVAAFRLGHAMVTETLEWNRYFQSAGTNPATMSQLFTFTGSHGKNFLGFDALPSSWVIDWTRFFDFAHFGIKSNTPASYSRRICPFIVRSLAQLPIPGKDANERSLAVRNLLRGRLLGLPSGQSIAGRLGITPLQPHEIAVGSHREILQRCGFDQLTPLWYYILRESEFSHRGERLGPVGSWIVAETFVGLIKSSRTSILPQDSNGRGTWRSQLTGKKEFSMAELLLFVSTTLETDFLNPLGIETSPPQ